MRFILFLLFLALTPYPVGGGSAAAETPAGPAAAVGGRDTGFAWASPLRREHPLVGRVWSRAAGGFVPAQKLLAAAGAADFLLIGERHDNPDHHRLQAWLLAETVAEGRRPAVLWEMIPAASDPVLADYRGSAEALGPALGWAESGWPDWPLYRPIAEVALAHGLPMRGTALPVEAVREAGRGGLGGLPAERRVALGLDVALPGAAEAELVEALRVGHCNLLPEPALQAMRGVQRLRDATMADAMLKARAETAAPGGLRPAVLIAGNGHTRPDHGVPWYLARRAPAAVSVSVALAEVAAGADDPAVYGSFGGSDFLLFTPAWDDKDHCEGLAERFSGTAGGGKDE